MNKMKNSFLMRAFVCLFTVVALCSCSKDDNDEADNIISAKVENGSSYNDNIDVVKAMIYTYKDGNYDEVELASSEYSNGGFTLKLPEPVSDTYLNALYDFPDGVTVSNPNVKTGIPYIAAYKSGKEVGEFYLSSSSDDLEADYVYSNGDVSITGTETYYYEGANDEIYTDNYNVHLKKGWNIVYGREIDKGNGEYEYEETTQKPSVTLKWYYDAYYSPSSTQGVRTKKVPSLLSKSRIRL